MSIQRRIYKFAGITSREICLFLFYKALSPMHHMLQQYNRLRKYISPLKFITEGKITAGHDIFIN